MADYNYDNFKPEYYDPKNFPGPKAGEKFIDISLRDLTENIVSLSDYLDKPTVIETGSITCPIYANNVPKMKSLEKKFPDINFLLVYVREAHPGERIAGHQTLADKIKLAPKVKDLYGDNRKVLVDDLGGSFHVKYGSMPDMVYVINTKGTVVFRGDWNNPRKLYGVLSGLQENQIEPEEHFGPQKPTPFLAVKVLLKGGWIAVKDFIKGIPGVIKLHKQANEAYK